jgi:hypothetical protein
MLGTAVLPEGVVSNLGRFASCARLFRSQAVLDPCPKLITNDLKLRPILSHQLVLVIAATLPFTRQGVFHRFMPVPDETAYIERVPKQSINPLRAPANRRMVPDASTGALHTLAIQVTGNFAWAGTPGVFIKDAPDDGRSLRVNFA